MEKKKSMVLVVLKNKKKRQGIGSDAGCRAGCRIKGFLLRR